MAEKNKELVKRWFEEVWNQKNEAAIDAMFHRDGKAHGFPDAGSVLVGPEEFKKVHRAFVEAFPYLRIQIEDLICEGDRLAVRWSIAMTHQGDSLGFPASGKAANLEGASFVVVKDGWIMDGWNHMDMHGLFQHLQSGGPL